MPQRASSPAWTAQSGGAPGDSLYLLFAGMLYDAAAGLYLTKTRAYNPKTGRFLQRDILDEQGKDGVYAGFPFGADAIGTNLYAWCKNNPVNMEDPSGEWGLRNLIRGVAQVARKLLGNPRGYIAGAANFTYGAARAAGAYQSAARAAVQVAKTVQTVTKTVVGKFQPAPDVSFIRSDSPYAPQFGGGGSGARCEACYIGIEINEKVSEAGSYRFKGARDFAHLWDDPTEDNPWVIPEPYVDGGSGWNGLAGESALLATLAIQQER